MNSLFRFKHFSILQEKSAMKVGTDSVLLGAWVSIRNNPKSILDIGTGTGLLALMLAQRTLSSEITAIEINEEACSDAQLNFDNSPWSDRINLIHGDVNSHLLNKPFDLIICNPPYFKDALLSGMKNRNTARHQDSLKLEELMEVIKDSLSINGVFHCILPYNQEESILNYAKQIDLYPFELCRVKGNKNTEYVRTMFSFSFKNKEVKVTDIILEVERHIRTEEYHKITEAFYL